MALRFRLLVLSLALCLVFPMRAPAPVIFRPGEKAKYEAPGGEVISGNANELFAKGQAAEQEGNSGRAIKIYKKLVKKYPHSSVAPEAIFRGAQLLEQRHDYLRAAGAYKQLMEDYAQTKHFSEAIEAQFRIGEMYLNGRKVKVLGIPLVTSMDDAVEIFAAVVRSAPYGRYTARAQFDIGRAREKQGSADLAIEAYQAVVEKFPNDPLAVDAQYQIGYIWLRAARAGTYDPNAIEQARTAFQDFLFRFPKSEKAPQARENLALLDRKETKSALDVAKFYDKAKDYRAAVIYYNEVIRQRPGTVESQVAQKRIDQLRAKVGAAALQSRAELAEKESKKKPAKKVAGAPATGAPSSPELEPPKPSMRGAPSDIAPLPATDSDSLPPPATEEPSATPDSSVTPEASPAPTP